MYVLIIGRPLAERIVFVCPLVAVPLPHTFEGWLRYQGFDAATASPHDLVMWRAA
jgi:hypothetical protein